jgi:nicotinic acid mononucleotide adenylyltransferase
VTVRFKKTAVFTFGRFNPPTAGHKLLVDVLKQYNGDHYVFLSHTVNTKTDPLAYPVKKHFVELFFPGVSVGDDSARTIIQVMQRLAELEYTDVVMVVGSDRVDSFSVLLNKYNGIEYQFDHIAVESAGVRDPDGVGVSAVSATKQRQAVLVGDRAGFALGTPNTQYSEELFSAVQQGLTE